MFKTLAFKTSNGVCLNSCKDSTDKSGIDNVITDGMCKMHFRSMEGFKRIQRAIVLGNFGIINTFVCVILASLCVNVGGYNIEVTKASFARGDAGSQFGYSLGVVKTPGWTEDNTQTFHSKTLLVGAPNATLTHFVTGVAIQGHGEVRECKINKRSRQDITCSHLETRDPENVCEKLSRNYNGSYCESNMRMGMTLSVNPKYDKLMDTISNVPLVTVCAPLWKNTYAEWSSQHNENYGMCLRMRDDLKVQDCNAISTSQKFGSNKEGSHSSNSDSDAVESRYCWPFWPTQGFGYVKGIPIFTYAQAGMSATYAHDGKSDIVGGPGARGWSGSVSFPAQSKFYPSDQITNHITMSEYAGYAVTSGRFDNLSTNVAVGVPNSYHANGSYFGEVILLQDTNKISEIHYGFKHLCPDIKSSDLPPFQENQVGTKFGASLAAVDLDGDGFDELLVGAPLYFGDQADEGRVFIYTSRQQVICGPVGILSGGSRVASLQDKAARARFGTTIASVGDLDLDGIQDVAIGAPYEEGGVGAVYIYRGNSGKKKDSSLLEDSFSQRIAGIDLDPGLRAFGWSIFGDVDVDDNAYPDLAIGAYASDTAVVLRSRPLVEVKVILTFDPDPIPLTADGLDCSEDGYRICTVLQVELSYNDSDVRRVALQLDLRADKEYMQRTKESRVFFRETRDAILSENITLHSGNPKTRQYILDVEFYLGHPTPKDQWTKMQVEGEIHLVDTHEDKFHKLDPILRDTVKNPFWHSTVFDNKCQEINLCESDTVVDVQLVFKRRGLLKQVDSATVLYLGNAQELVVTIDITNKMDTSYGVNFTLDANVKLKEDIEFSNQGMLSGNIRPIDDESTMTSNTEYTGRVCQNTGNDHSVTSVHCLGVFRLAENDKLRAVAYLDVSPELLAPLMDLKSLKNRINITVRALQTNIDNNVDNNEFSISIPVQLQSNLTIQGDMHTSDQMRMSRDKESDVVHHLHHRFYITNMGPSFSLETFVKILVPVSKGLDQIASVTNMSSSCSMSVDFYDQNLSSDVEDSITEFIANNGSSEYTTNLAEKASEINCLTYECDVIICRLPSLAVQQQESVFVEIDVNENKMADLQFSWAIRFVSTAVILDPSFLHGAHVASWSSPSYIQKWTTFRVRTDSGPQTIPLWVFLASGGAAVLFLLILIFILYKCGFFRRKKHSEVIKWKEESLYAQKSKQQASTPMDSLVETRQITYDSAGVDDQSEESILRHKSRGSIATPP